MTEIGLKTQKPGGIHKPRIIFLIIAIFVLVTKKRTYPGDSFPSPGDLVLTPFHVKNTPNISSNTNLITVITNPHHHTSTNEPILYILSLPPSLRLVW